LDSNNDGHFNSYELRNALNAVGMLYVRYQLLRLVMLLIMVMADDVVRRYCISKTLVLKVLINHLFCLKH